ncbi:alpha-amylase family glycosyl hydrolase [Trueperella pyogenes]|uniref:alpha-amylase family glycosyl hydrolase n=1 Tax=Trueperella pyogenes TaxID=1661 RepID=UPI00345CBBE7
MTKLRNLTTCSLPLGIQVRSTSFSELDEREQHLPCWQRYRERDTCTKGEELGLSEHLDLAPEQRQDPIWIRSKGEQLGREGCRIPLPWSPHTPTLGFSDCPNAAAWLPQPENYGQLTRDAQQTEPDSMLTLYKRLLCLRKELSDFVSYVEWIDTDDPQLLAFDNGAFICLTNTSDDDLTVPVDMIDRVLISTQEADDRTIPANSTLWVLRRPPRKTGTAPVSTMSCTVA